MVSKIDESEFMDKKFKNNKCYLCKQSNIEDKFPYTRDNKNIKVLKCQNCNLIFLSSFEHIQNDFYKNSGMHKGNIELQNWIKSTLEDDLRRFDQLKDNINDKKILDFGCGNGGFLLKARESARSVFGLELDQGLNNYFKDQNLKVYSNLEQIEDKFDVITMFHVLEHIPKPIELLTSLKRLLNKGGKIIVEVPNANDALISIYDSKAFQDFTYWSCHLFLFNEDHLRDIINSAGFKKIDYIKQFQRYSITNHLYWLAKGLPGGHKKWNHLLSEDLNKEYINMLKSQKACDSILASFTI